MVSGLFCPFEAAGSHSSVFERSVFLVFLVGSFSIWGAAKGSFISKRVAEACGHFVLHCLCHQTKQALCLALTIRSTRTLFDNFRKFLTPIMDRLSKIWLTQLPHRITEGGHGGGSPISLEELKSAILLEDGDSRICQRSVCHIDGTRTYKQLGDVDSPLLDREVFDVEFSDLHLAHTAVKHKPPRPEFAKTFQVKVWTGSAWVQEERQGGTQKLDGFFASFQREVGRRPFNTAGPSLQTAANMEQHLHERVCCFQFADWLSGSDLLRDIKLSQVHKDGDF